MDKTIVSFFFENFISFNFADSSSFVLAAHDRREHDILQKKNLFKVTKPLPTNIIWGAEGAP